MADHQSSIFVGQVPDEFQQTGKAITCEKSNGLTVQDDLSALTGIDDGNGFLDRICIK